MNPPEDKETIKPESPAEGDNANNADAAVPAAHNQEKAEDNAVDAVAQLVAQNQELIKTLGETNRLMESQRKAFDKELASMKERFHEVEQSLPQRSVDEKAEVLGYYDFDTAHNRLLSEEAISDKDRAFKDLNFLTSQFR